MESAGPVMSDGFIPKHGGYKQLLSYQKSEIVYDATVYFCDRCINKRSRTHDQMVQAARSGKQNIIEGSMASATSKEAEIKLTNVARASLEELLADYQDFLRTRGLRLWEKDSKIIDSAFDDLLQLSWRDLVIGFEDYFATFLVDDVGNSMGAIELLNINLDLADIRFP